MNNKVIIKQLDPKQRIHNFDEVVLGYDDNQAINEANRCLNCINHPCVDACPINNDIPGFISKIKENKIKEAYEIITKNSSMPSICSRVCSYEEQCQKNCTRGKIGDAICIGALERFVCDNCNEKQYKQENNNHKIVVVGSGPSGLTCAKKLAILGYDVTVIEAKDILGGILNYGIPEFRLPKDIVKNEIDKVIDLGVHIKTNTELGKDITVESLLKEYEFVYLAIGVGEAKLMNIKGENLKGFYNANDFLYEVNLNKNNIKEIVKDKRVIVIGGGNVAMDVARSATRLDAKKVDVVYRRSINEAPASKDELKQAMDEGIIFNFLVNPIEICKANSDNEEIGSIKCIKMQLGEPDEKGRRRPMEIKGSEFVMEADIVVEAISSKTDLNAINEIKLNKYGYPIVDENNKTSNDRVYAGGDLVLGPSSVVMAIKTGKKVAEAIDKYYQN